MSGAPAALPFARQMLGIALDSPGTCTLGVLTALDHTLTAFLLLLYAASATMVAAKRRRIGAGTPIWNSLRMGHPAVCAAAVLTGWLVQGRTLADLGIVAPRGVAGLITLALATCWVAVSYGVSRQCRSDGTICEACRVKWLERTAWVTWGVGRRAPVWEPILAGTIGMAEELVFRGWFLWYFLSNSLRLDNARTGVGTLSFLPELAQYPRWHIWGAVLASGVLFAALHGAQKRAALVALTLIMGCANGAAVVFSGSLLPALFVHAGHNAAIAWLGVHLSRLPTPKVEAGHADNCSER